MTRPLPVVHAATDDALGEDDVCGLVARLDRREVSPDELVTAALARARAVNDRLNGVACWVSTDAMPPTASGGDAPFAGIPTLVKDNEMLAGHPTLQGSRAVPPVPALESSPWVSQLLDLGFVPVAKTTLPEFGLTASTESSGFGATRNPWNPDHSPGGSSGGSAALVASGVVPLAHANDGGGSIRIPASCCGLVGLKPSRGRLVDRPELDRLPVPITVQGVLTRTVRDTAAYYAAAERHHPPVHLPAIGNVTEPSPRRLRIGLVEQPPHGIAVSPDVHTCTLDAARTLEHLGHHVDAIAAPVDDRFGPDFLIYWQLLSFGLQHGGRSLFGPGFDPTRTEPLTRYLSRRLTADLPRLPSTLRRLRRLAREHEQVFDRYDLVLSPVLAHEPPPTGHLGPDVDPVVHVVRLLRWIAFTPLQNVSGSPAISLPLGRSTHGLPIGLQLAAPFGHERRLLEVALELEQATGWQPGRQ
jgi:amidase